MRVSKKSWPRLWLSVGFEVFSDAFARGFELFFRPFNFYSTHVAFAFILNVFCICGNFSRKGSKFCGEKPNKYERVRSFYEKSQKGSKFHGCKNDRN